MVPAGLRLLCALGALMRLPQATASSDPDSLTVLFSNTYLLEVRAVVSVSKKPNIAERRDGYIRWFRDLTESQVPDVVVLSEIYSHYGDSVVKSLCSDSWERNSPGWKTLACKADSKFQKATAAVNAVSSINPKKCGGVVVLTKKGIEMVHAQDEQFKTSAGADQMSNKGFWAVQIEKAGKRHWIVATHTQAYGGPAKAVIRREQFAHMRKYIDDNAAADDRVAFVGDMNIFTGPYEEGGTKYNESHIETDGMLMSLGGGDETNKTVGCTLAPRGFWAPLDADIKHSVEIANNHYINNLPSEKLLGNQHMDWVIVPGTDDSFPKPTESKCQFLPMKTNICFDSDLNDKYTDDLTDHYAIFAQLCYGKACPSITQLTGYKGKAGRLPSGPNCPEGKDTTPASCDTGSCCPGSITKADFDLLVQKRLTDATGKYQKDFSGRCHAKSTTCGACSTPLIGSSVWCADGEVCECVTTGNRCKNPEGPAASAIISGASHPFDSALNPLLCLLPSLFIVRVFHV